MNYMIGVILMAINFPKFEIPKLELGSLIPNIPKLPDINNMKFKNITSFFSEINSGDSEKVKQFAREIIKEASMQMGLGDNFAIISGDYVKEQIYEKYLNDFIAKKEAENPNFINEIKLPLYQFRKMLIEFSNQLYNKSIDIKKIKKDELGNAPGLLPFFNEIIFLLSSQTS